MSGLPRGDERPGVTALTGRIGADPGAVMTQEVLRPQFDYEVRHLLPWYVRLEQVLVLEYLRMDLISAADARAVAAALASVTGPAMAGGAADAMTDAAFTLERRVAARVPELPARWHVDRSRNDLQASAQMLHFRERLRVLAETLLSFATRLHDLADRTVEMVMPGYTHLQPAQIISPAFYLTAVSAQVLHTAHRLEAAYDSADRLPLGAGAMAGQELAWDRDVMARLLGCAAPREHALQAVAGRDWALESVAEISNFGVVMSRFVTDLMTWGGAGHQFIDLPDEWSGISSAMPQKKNFPVLERIRGRTARLSEAYLGVALAQRSTPYSNGIEVSKEAGSAVADAFDRAESVLRLLTGVATHLTFRDEIMRAACLREHFGGFTLANLLTLHEDLPWREAQIVAGAFIVASVRAGRPPDRPDAALLSAVARRHGHAVRRPGRWLDEAFDVDRALLTKRSAGSTRPDAVREMLAGQRSRLAGQLDRWRERRRRVDAGLAELDRRLALVPAEGARP
ncbi:argininosuccinate lyase [Actinomadura sp. 9N215]|uniref:argininosuccinate lyase n=1 Tax=Actinomadura sp. 9N215 TaxID=3375150 RepID=UPI0037A516BA